MDSGLSQLVEESDQQIDSLEKSWMIIQASLTSMKDSKPNSLGYKMLNWQIDLEHSLFKQRLNESLQASVVTIQ